MLKRLSLQALILYAIVANAIYFIDDQNTTISYSPEFAFSPDKGAYNKSLTYVACVGCHMTVPFTGSGITLYIAHGDDNVRTTNVLDADTTAVKISTTVLPDTGRSEAYNVTLYDVQSLPYGNHSIMITLEYWEGTIASSLWFDYAIVNDTNPATSTVSASASTTSPTASATPSSSSTKISSYRMIGPIIGGIIIGLVFISALIVVLLVCVRRRRKSVAQALKGIDAEVKPWNPADESFFGSAVPLLGSHDEQTIPVMTPSPEQRHAAPMQETISSVSNPPFSKRARTTTSLLVAPIPQPSTKQALVNSRHTTSLLAIPVPESNSEHAPSKASYSSLGSSLSSHATPVARLTPVATSSQVYTAPQAVIHSWPSSGESSQDHPRLDMDALTDAQADLIRDLWTAHVSPHHIARVIQRMRSGGADSNRQPDSVVQLGDITDGGSHVEPPPGYEV